jgi:SPP1 gp7 family putative phage head morphogenesis protein
MYVLALSGTYNREVREMINSTNPELGDYLRRAVAGLSPTMSRMSNTGFNTVADRVRQIRKKGFDKAKAFLREKAGEMAESQLDRTVATLSDISDSRVLTVSAGEINGILSFGSFNGRNMAQWWKDLETSDLGRIMAEVRGGVSAGAGTEEVIKSVKDALGVTLRGAEALVRTVMTGVSNETLNVLFEKNVGTVPWVVWSAILDGRTSEICLSLDGQRWRVGTAHPVPPAHYHCRSSLVGQVDEAGAPEITADEWLKGQSVAFQEQLIGVGKSKLFRSGKIGVRDLVRQRSLKPLTLDEVKRLG